MSERDWRDAVALLFTMDVEPVSTGPGVSGPLSAAAGEKSIRDYAALLEAHGLRGTFFLHPEVAQDQAGLFHELAAAGHALGLHLHTVKYGDVPSPVELGGMTAGQQREMLRRATDAYAAAIGQPPRFFRPGCFSANDATFPVLLELGFSGGSVSIPGRVWPERYCVWSGACPDPHLAHPCFRGARGDLPFVEIPLSVDLDGGPCVHPREGFTYYADLRPGDVYADDEGLARDHAAMLHRILARMRRDNPPVKTLVVDVHNDRDFVGDSLAATHLRALLEGMAPAVREAGWEPVPATFGTLVPELLASPGALADS